jgi:hypothetical protein
MRRQCAAWTELTETRTKANRRPIVGGWCNFATTTRAVWPGLTQSLSLQGCSGAAGSTQAPTHIPRTQETAARGQRRASSQTFKRSEDAKDERQGNFHSVEASLASDSWLDAWAHQVMLMHWSDRHCLATPNLDGGQRNHRAVPCRSDLLAWARPET